MVANESANGVGRDVTKAAVESVYVDTFDWSCDGCGVGMFNSEQAMLVCRNATDLLACWADNFAGARLRTEIDIAARIVDAADGDDG